jgi:putative transcriptional regulator
MYTAVVESVLRILSKAGFDVTDLIETKPRCFDVVARKENVVLLIKVLYNVFFFKQKTAYEMKLVAKLLGASSLVVGERFKSDYLERGVVYNRYGLPVINTATFYDFIIEGIHPVIYSAPGGYYVKLNKEKIKEARERKGLTLGMLARKLGVSRRVIKKYEGGADASLENAAKLEELLGEYIVKEIDLLNFTELDEVKEIKPDDLNKNEAEIVEQLKNIGLNVYAVKHAPFDIVSKILERKNEGEAILAGVRQVREIEKRAAVIGKVSEVVSAKAAYIVERKIKKDVSSVVFLLKEELTCVSSPKDLVSLIKERYEDTF